MRIFYFSEVLRMPGFKSSLWSVLLIIFLLPACSGGKSTDKETADTKSAEDGAGSKTSANANESAQSRFTTKPKGQANSIVGRWKLSFFQSGASFDLGLFEISANGDHYDVKLVALSPMFDAAKVKSAE